MPEKEYGHIHGLSMNGIDHISGMETSAGALRAFSIQTQIAAHNIANISTNGFEPVAASLADGPAGKGVRVSALWQGGTPITAKESTSAKHGDTPSGTDLAREVVSLISSQRAFEANAQTIATQDAMLGYLLDTRS